MILSKRLSYEMLLLPFETCIINGYDSYCHDVCGGAFYVSSSGEILAELEYKKTGLLIFERKRFV